jgi:anti-sigma-K factor RskA
MTPTANGNGKDPERAVDYVLGHLERADADAFEARLAADCALRTEVERLRSALELLPYASATEPPPALRSRVLRAAQAESTRTPSTARRERQIVWTRFAAAAAVVLALILGADAYRLRSELALQHEVTSLLQQPNVVLSFSLAGTGEHARAHGAVALDLDAKKGAVVLRRLPRLPSGQVYSLWARVGDVAVPCGDFSAAADGGVRAPFAVPVESYKASIDALFVTVEPRAGGDHPTGPTVMESA